MAVTAAGGQVIACLPIARRGLCCPGRLARPSSSPCLVACSAGLSGRPLQQLQGQRYYPQQQQPQQQPTGSTGTSQGTPAAHITQNITQCRTVTQLEGVFRRNQHQLNPIHVGALLSKLAKLATQQDSTVGANSSAQHLLAHLVPLFSTQLQQMGPRVLANSIWSLAKLGHVPDQLLVNRMWLSLVPAIPHMLPQQLSSLLWALASWHKQLQVQQGVFAAWEWQVVGALPVPPPVAAGYSSQHQATTGGPAVMQHVEAMQTAAETSTSSPTRWKQSCDAAADGVSVGSTLNSSTGSSSGSSSSSSSSSTQGQLHLLRLGLTPGRLQLLEEATGSCLHSFTPQGLSNMLYAWAVLGVVPSSAWCDLFWRVSGSALHHFEPQHLSNTVWAAAKLQLQPPPAWVGRWWGVSQQALPRSTPQGCSNMLWAVAVLGWPVLPGWAEAFARVTQARLAQWPEQALTNCCWAWGTLARQGEQLYNGNNARSSSPCHAHQQQQPGMNRRQLLSVLEDTGWAAAALGASFHGLRHWSNSQQLANTLWGFSALGLLPPPRWLETFFTATAPRLKQCMPEELSHLLVACARLQVQPGEAWMAVWEAAATKALPLIHGYHLANIAWSLVQIGHVPGEVFQQQYLREVVIRLRSGFAEPGGSGALPAGTYSSTNGEQQQGGRAQPQTIASSHALPTSPTPSVTAAAASLARGRGPVGADTAVTSPTTSTAAGTTAPRTGDSSSGSRGSAADSKWHLDSRGISVLAWALARQGWCLPPKLWLLLQQAALQQLAGFTLHGCVLLLWALSAAQQPVVQGLLDGVMEGAARHVQQLQQELQAARAAAQQQQQEEEVGADVQAAEAALPGPSNMHLEQRRVQLLNDVVLLLWVTAQLGAAPAAEPLLPVVAWAQSQLCALLYRCHDPAWQAAHAQGSAGAGQAAAAQAMAARVGMSLPLVRKQQRQQQQAVSVASEGSYTRVGVLAHRLGRNKGATAVGPARAEGQALQAMLQSPVLAAAARWSVMLLYSLAAIGFHPGTQQLKPWYRWSGRALLLLTPRDLAQLMWSCVALEEVPPRGWLVRWQAAWQHSTQLLPVLAPDLELLREALSLVQQRDAQRQQQTQEEGAGSSQQQPPQQQELHQHPTVVQPGVGASLQQQLPSLDASTAPQQRKPTPQPTQQRLEEAYMPLAEWRQVWRDALSLEQRLRCLELLLQQSLAQSA